MQERKHLKTDALYQAVHTAFCKIADHRKNKGNIKSTISDALMSGLAVGCGAPRGAQYIGGGSPPWESVAQRIPERVLSRWR